MSTNPNVTVRYSDAELQEFKAIIDEKLSKATVQFNSLKEQLKDLTENNNDDFAKDITDFSSIQSELEMLNNMANHQRKFIQDLENALIRISNKSYGICVVTGELIDKKRLLAVPTTTKSVQAKTSAEMEHVQSPKSKLFDEEEDMDENKIAKAAKPRTPVILTKVIKKDVKKNPAPVIIDDELDKIFSEIDIDADLPNVDLEIEDDGDDDIGFNDDEDLDMIADDGADDFDENDY